MKSLVKRLINSSRISSAEKEAFSGEKIYILNTELKVTVVGKNKQVEVWFAIPRNTINQNLLENSFSKPEPKILKDETYGNSVAYWVVRGSEEGNILTFTQISEVSVRPHYYKKIEGNIDNYRKDSIDYKLYVRSDPYFNFTDSRVQNIARGLMGDEERVGEVAKKFYEYVRENVSYGNPIEGLYSSIDSLEKDVVDCGGYACLLGAMFRSVGIPARLVSGILAGYPGEHMHAWLEFMTPEEVWIPADPSSEKLRLQKRDFKPGGFGIVGNDRIILSLGTNIKITTKTFPLIQLPIVEAVPNTSIQSRRTIEAKQK